MPYVIPIEYIGGTVDLIEELFQVVGDGGFTRSRQSCEPDCRPFVAVELLPILFGDVSVEPGDVVGIRIRFWVLGSGF